MPQYCVLSQMKVTSMSELKALWAHNAREYTPRNCNPDETFMNEYMISRESYMDIFHRIIKEKNIKLRKDAVYALEYTSKFSPGTQLNLQEWKEQNQKFFEDTFGKENVVSMIVHFDEHSPHIHTLVIPTVKRTRKLKSGEEQDYWNLSAKSFTGGKAAMQKLQADYETYMKQFGLQKGKTVKADKARHEDIMKFYQDVDHAANFTPPSPKIGETATEYVKRATPVLRQEGMNYFRKIKKLQKELHEKDVVLEDNENLIQWKTKINDDDLIRRLTELSERELRKLLEKHQQQQSIYQNLP